MRVARNQSGRGQRETRLKSAQGRLHLVRGEATPEALEELEMEMSNRMPGEDSPDRMDALVHAVNYCEDSSQPVMFDADALRFFHGR